MKSLVLFFAFLFNMNISYAGVTSDTVGCFFGLDRAIQSMTLILLKDGAGKVYAQTYVFTLPLKDRNDPNEKYSLLMTERYPLEQSQKKTVNAQLDLLFDDVIYEIRSHVDLTKATQTVSFDGELFTCSFN